MSRREDAVPTGNGTLDEALGGGLPHGTVIVLEGEEGAGSTEFAVTVLRAVQSAGTGHRARFASALRSPARVEREITRLFEDPKDAAAVEMRAIRPQQAQADCIAALSDCAQGDVLVIESASALMRAEAGRDLAGLVQILGNIASEISAIVLILSTPRALPPDVEAAVQEAADGVFGFTWRDGGTTRRRILQMRKLRGLAPALDGEQISVFEVGLQRGVGFSISAVKNVV